MECRKEGMFEGEQGILKAGRKTKRMKEMKERRKKGINERRKEGRKQGRNN